MATKYQNYITGADAEYNLTDGTKKFAQSFTVATAHRITSVKLLLYRTGSPGTLIVGIYNIVGPSTEYFPGGNPLCSGTYDGDTLGTDTDGAWVEITLGAGRNLAVSSVYAVQLTCSGASASNKVHWRYDDSSPTFSGGRFNYYSGTAWSHTASDDMMFEEWGESPTIDESTYDRLLVSFCNNEVWYEPTPGTKVELTDANGAIDTNEPLQAVEAYQKVFIVNGTNLKVIDFINTKITTGDIKPTDKVIPLNGTTLTGGDSGASMIVDYIDASDSTCNVYGYRTTVVDFEDTETVTGTVTTTDDVTFVLNADGVSPPHWYSWTVYSGDATTYGTMPTSSSLISLYRGRIVINDDYLPHAWLMTKVGNPWKIKYDYTNDGDLSAVTHTSTKVGKIGDINTAYIDYKDDLFIFGCANSIWILVGDALSSGQLARITKTTGIWGSRAWCMDDKSNLYFLGESGIYRMPVTESYSSPENISILALPNLIADLDLDKGLHRVVLGFDPINYGIIISKTLLSDGSNTNYWFSLLTQGFYLEEYPDSCGIFSACYYPAIDDTYKKFLVGCNDGYIREFDAATKNDATTSSTTAIDSYFAVVNPLSEDEDIEGKLIWINGVTAGGATGGDFGDTDNVDYSLYISNDAETTLEKMKAETDWATGTVYAVGTLVIYSSIEYRCITAHTSDSSGPPYEEPDTNTTDWLATAFTTGTWSDTGKQTKNRVRMRGSWAGLKLRNSTASKTWAIDKIYGEVKPAGKSR